MARETKERMVGGFKVLITKHPARGASKLLAKLGRTIAPAFLRLKEIDLTKLMRTTGPAVPAGLAAVVPPPPAVDAEVIEHNNPAELTQEEQLGTLGIDIDFLAPAIEALFGALSDAAIDALIEDTLKHTTIILPGDDGQLRPYDLSNGDTIDEAFADRLVLMYRVMGAVVGVNFGGFFSGKGGLAAIAQAAAASWSRSTSPANSASSGTASTS